MSIYGNRQPNDPYQAMRGGDRPSMLNGLKLRLLIGGAIVLFAAISYISSSTQRNPVTDKEERVGLSINDEIKLGLQHAGQMGQLSRDYRTQQRVVQIGDRLVTGFEKALSLQNKTNPYRFEFNLLADRKTINAFALPGGQIFITEGLLHRLKHDGEVAGVLAHEMGHVIERHSSKQMAKSGLISGVAGAAGVLLGGDQRSSQMGAALGNIASMRFSRDAEFEADKWGAEICILAGYNPKHLLGVMDTLAQAGGGQGPPEFFSTHPKTESRVEAINEVISRYEKDFHSFEGFE